ncbi:MAG: hypothetical protein EOM05_08080 [Clostridia bacterium]|nr:hypothetical protein [Clostridia bacterium]
MKINRKYISYLLAFFILLTGTLLGSEVVIDKTLLPRFLFVNIVFFVMLIFYRKKLNVRFDVYLFIFTAYYLFNLFSAFWSISFQEAFFQSQLVFLGLTCFILILLFKNEFENFEEIFNKLILFFILFSILLSAETMISLEYFDPYKIKSVSANNNLYSGFLFLSLAFSINGIVKFKSVFKYLSLFTLLSSLFVMIISQSRSIYLATLFTLLLFIIIIAIKYRVIINKQFIITSIISIFILGFTVFVFYHNLDPIRKNYFQSKLVFWKYVNPTIIDEESSVPSFEKNTTVDSLSSSDNKNQTIPAFDEPQSYYENANLRLIFWEKSLTLFKQNSFIGIGSGNWKLSIASALEPTNPNHTKRNYTYSFPHNEFVGLLTELGIIGFTLGIIVWFFIPVSILFFVIKKNKLIDFTHVVYAIIILGFFVFAFFDFPLKRIEHNVLLFTIMGFAYFPIMSKFKEYSKFKVKFLFFSYFTLILFITFSIVISIYRIKGEYFTLKMFNYERVNDRKVILLCDKAENYFYKITPNTLPLKWFQGVAYFRSGDIVKANELFEKAKEETPYEVRVLNDYATTLVLLKKNDEAKNILCDCLKIDPYFDDAKFNLAAIYVFTNQHDSALYYVNLCSDSQKKTDYLNEIHQMLTQKQN